MSQRINFAEEVASAFRICLIAEQTANPQQWVLVRFNRTSGTFIEGQFALAKPEVLLARYPEGTFQTIPIWNAKQRSCQHVELDSLDFVERNVRLSMQVESCIN